METPTVDTKIDWSSIYASKNFKPSPATNFTDLEKEIISGLFLKWSEIPVKNDRGNPLRSIMIFTDVLLMDKTPIIDKNTIIVSRRIEVEKNKELFIRRTSDENPYVLIMAQEVVSAEDDQPLDLPLIVMHQKSGDLDELKVSYSPHLDSDVPKGAIWKMDQIEPDLINPDELDETLMKEGEPLRIYTRTLFQNATLFFNERPEICIAQLKWVAMLASCSDATKELRAESLTLLNIQIDLLNSPKNALLVPQLDHSVFAEEVDSGMSLFKMRHVKWLRYQESIKNKEHWLEAASDALEKEEIQEDLLNELLKRAIESRYEALEAMDKAAMHLVAHQLELLYTQKAFEAGVEEWKRNEEFKAGMEIATGAFEMLSAIPDLAAGGKVGAVEIINSSLAGLKTATDVLNGRIMKEHVFHRKDRVGDYGDDIELQEMNNDNLIPKSEDIKKPSEAELKALKEKKASTIAGVKKLAGGGVKIANGINKIIEANARAEMMIQQSQEALNSTNSKSDSSLQSSSLIGIDVVTGGQQEWEILSEELKYTFDIQVPEFKEISSGPDYRLGLQKMIVLGQTLCQTKLALAKANSDLAEIKLRINAAKSTTKIFKKRIAKLKDHQYEDRTISQLIYGRILDAKRSVFLSMESYRRALIYFTMAGQRQVPKLPKLNQSIEIFDKTTRQMTGKKLEATMLGKYQPQMMHKMEYTIQEKPLIESLRKTGHLTWSLSPKDSNFFGFGRVRVNEIQVETDGLPKGKKILVSLVSSGVYLDKGFNGGVKQFVTEPFFKNLVFQSDQPEKGIHANVAPRFEGDFFLPTPFTTWTIRISSQDQKIVLDLSKITYVKVSFTGESSSISE